MTLQSHNPAQSMPPDNVAVRALYPGGHPQTLVVDHGQWMTVDHALWFVHPPVLWRMLSEDEVKAGEGTGEK